jgi:hypothetical protein
VGDPPRRAGDRLPRRVIHGNLVAPGRRRRPSAASIATIGDVRTAADGRRRCSRARRRSSRRRGTAKQREQGGWADDRCAVDEATASDLGPSPGRRTRHGHGSRAVPAGAGGRGFGPSGRCRQDDGGGLGRGSPIRPSASPDRAYVGAAHARRRRVSGARCAGVVEPRAQNVPGLLELTACRSGCVRC